MNVPNAYEWPPAALSGVNGLGPADEVGAETPCEVVVVDARIDRYAGFVAAANVGRIGLHFCSDAQSAIKLSRRFRADVWLVSTDLPDMELFELLPLLGEQIEQTSVGRRGRRAGLFVVAEEYRIDDEHRALEAGVAGYLTLPVTVDIVQSLRLGEHAFEDAFATA